MTASDIANVPWITNQDRLGDPIVHELLRCADDLRLVTFGEHHTLWVSLRAVDEPAHYSAGASKATFQPVAIFVQIYELARGTTRHSGPRNCGCDPQKDARIEREGD